MHLISFRSTEEIYQKLRMLAVKLDCRSVSDLVNKIVTEWLERVEE